MAIVLSVKTYCASRHFYKEIMLTDSDGELITFFPIHAYDVIKAIALRKALVGAKVISADRNSIAFSSDYEEQFKAAVALDRPEFRKIVKKSKSLEELEQMGPKEFFEFIMSINIARI